MVPEHRILHRHAARKPAIEIAWNAIQQAGNDLMTKSGEVEHGYALAGSVVADGQGGVIAKVHRVLSLGSGTAGAFHVSPELARDIGEHPYAPGEMFMGLAHSHRRIHRAEPSDPDLEYARRLTNGRVRVCMVIKLNEDERGHRNGGAKLSVFDGDGFVDYAIVGNGQRQEFKADKNGRIDAATLQSPADPPKPETVESRRGRSA